MKNLLTRTLALLLVLLMVVGACACSKEEKEETTEKTIEPLPGETPVDLNGFEFKVVDYIGGRFTKENSGTPYTDAWVQIMDEVETLYNCTITCDVLNISEMFTIIQPEIAAGGKYADLIVSTQWQYGTFLGAGLMKDLNELDVNWDNEWWNQTVRNMSTYGGKTYVGGGSFIFDTTGTWLLYYNEAIWNQHGFEDPYKLVDEGRWTQDLFAKYCREASQDTDNSGALDSYDDIWGVLAADGDFCRAWFMGMGGKYFETDPNSGKVKLACNNQRTFDIIEKMFNMVQKDKTVCRLQYETGEPERVAHFVNGNALFYAYVPGVGGLQDMEDDWGVMPMPKFDENQETYLSGVDHNSAVFGVTNTNTDVKEVSAILEALGRHAMILEDIYWPDYKETYWRHEEKDTHVVSEYVVGHGQHDLALIMQNCNSVFSAPMGRVFGVTFHSSSSDFASWVESVEPVIEIQLEDYFQY
ncbi:MAG: extracellular solute-binding protein [Clostridia bacterium]|nr:extracellular solute-binding protein [Clostridia bacterium]